MTQHQRDIISRLYKPRPDGVRQVFAMSRAAAEKLPRLTSVAIISITAPERPLASLDGFDHVLRLSFADVDFLSPDLSKRAVEKLAHAFTQDQAQAVRSFVEVLPDEIRSVVVHCEGGYSRSSAIAVALSRLYGFHTEVKHLSQANRSVVLVMTGDDAAFQRERR